MLVEPVVVLQAEDFVLAASRFTNRRWREAGSKVRRALLILDVESTDVGEVKYVERVGSRRVSVLKAMNELERDFY